MHRTQINLTTFQYQFLSTESKKSGSSISELIRQLVQQQFQTSSKSKALRQEIIGIGKSKERDAGRNHDKYLYS